MSRSNRGDPPRHQVFEQVADHEPRLNLAEVDERANRRCDRKWSHSGDVVRAQVAGAMDDNALEVDPSLAGNGHVK